MSLHKTEAVILRNARSGESSLLVYSFLKDGGRMNLLAKGARNPKSAMVGRLEPFNHVEILYYQSDIEKLGVVSQVDVIRSNETISTDIRRLSYASAVVEGLEAVTPPNDTNHDIFRLLNDAIYQMNYCHGTKYDFYFAAFLLKLLSISGFHPEMRCCVKTGVDLSEESEVLFSAEQGGVMSRSAAESNGRFFKLNKGVRKVLDLILSSDIGKLSGVNFSPDQKKLVRALVLKFLAVHTDRERTITSLDFLDRIKPAD